MKQVFNLSGKTVVIDVPIPAINDYEILIRNIYSAVSSGTETASIESAKGSLISRALKERELISQGLEILKEYGLLKTIERIKEQKHTIHSLGYSCCGEVIKVGKKINDISVGDHVACGGAYANHAEFVAAPRNLAAKIPEGVDFQSASFTTIGAISLQGIRRANVHIGDYVAVIGLGLLGQIASQILTSFGCKVIGVDIDENKVNLAIKLGLKKGFVSDEKLVEKILDYTENIGVDSVIIYAATKSSEPVNTAMKICRKKGIVVVVGAVGMDLKRDEFYKKELDFRISTSYGPGRYDSQYEEKGIDYPIEYVRWTENRNMKEFVRMLKENLINLKPLINREYPISEAFNAYNFLQNEKEIIGMVFSYPHKNEIKITSKLFVSKSNIKKGRINVGVIGCGSFAQSYHLPNVIKNPLLNLTAVSSKTGTNAKTVAEKYMANYCTTNYYEIIDDENIDLIIISTRHNLHAQMVLEGIKAGKHIFVEKPLCLTENELCEIETAFQESKVNLCVGFNRRFAPIIVEAKKYISEYRLLEKGLLISIRINSAGMNKEHWINDPEEGGGAIIGEACHFFDLMNYFSESKPIDIQVSMLSSKDESIVDWNNIIANIKYNNGVLGSILYSTLATTKYPKERFEFFGKNTVIFVDDYKNILIEGYDTIKDNFNLIKKGHFELLDNYTKYLLGDLENSNQLPINEIAFDSMKLTFEILGNLRAKYGEKL